MRAGGQMFGEFPTRLEEFESAYNVGRGRFIPTTPWESVWHGVSQWFGVTDKAALNTILPHAKNFNASTLFGQDALYSS